NPAEAERRGMSIRFWDFLFYASFGFVVTSSVAIAGVLLVFCYLIVPSVGAMLFAERVGRRLAIGWTMGTLVSALGVYFSVLWDLPTGATIVCTFGGVLVDVSHPHPLFSCPGCAPSGRRCRRREVRRTNTPNSPVAATATKSEPKRGMLLLVNNFARDDNLIMRNAMLN